jgi:hypothetical protein
MNLNYLPSRKAVCVDLDATLAHRDPRESPSIIGQPLEGAQNFLQYLKAHGLQIIIMTSRCWPFGPDGSQRDTVASVRRVEEWLKLHNMPFDEIHGKPYAIAYVDDQAVVVRKNPVPGEYARALAEIEQLAFSEYFLQG